MAGYITHVDDVEPWVDSDSVSARTTIDGSVGAERLVQSVFTFSTGTSPTRRHEDRDEIAYIVSGDGSLILEGVNHDLKPDIGVYIRAGESYQVLNEGPEALVMVSVTAPVPDHNQTSQTRKVIVDTADQPVIPAGKDREFKFVINPDAGCQEVTQFVGWIPPGRAPTHYHLYDEVMYILDGEGVLHLDGQPDTPIRPGTCIHLPPPVEHCVENTGDRPL
ncbi:MAG TPA: cupin domain-containing protein, partial [Acidimicrobiia bacterium]|nr:cupin domain-containing protein [Acidimicrobiia bacterium]